MLKTESRDRQLEALARKIIALEDRVKKLEEKPKRQRKPKDE